MNKQNQRCPYCYQQKMFFIITSIIILGLIVWGASTYINMADEVAPLKKKLAETQAALEYSHRMFDIYEGYYNQCKEELNKNG